MDAQEELAFLRSVAASQLQTIKALTLGCEKYGLTETTPIVRHLAAQDDEIERLRAELSDAYAEVHKQVAVSKVIFDRALVNRAKASLATPSEESKCKTY